MRAKPTYRPLADTETSPAPIANLQRSAFRLRRLRTTNALERLDRELHRRTRVATLFPNEASLLHFVSAMAAEISEEWETGDGST